MTDMGDKGPRELNFGALFFFVIVPESYPGQQSVDVVLVFADVAFCYSIFFTKKLAFLFNTFVYCAFPFFHRKELQSPLLPSQGRIRPALLRHSERLRRRQCGKDNACGKTAIENLSAPIQT